MTVNLEVVEVYTN